jgi:hypothetical protein
LEVRDGRLVGRTTSTVPVVHLVGTPPRDGSDTVEELEIRIRVSSGANLFVGCSGGKPGLLGLWGAAIVRSLGAMPRAATWRPTWSSAR